MIIEKNDTTYTQYRIPGLVITKKQTLLGYYECRRTASDWADIDIKIIRSTDKGDTWQTAYTIYGEGNTLNNPVMIIDNDTIHFLYCKNYKQLYYCKSNDDGLSFSDAVEITAPFENCGFYYSVLAVGPGHSIMHNGNIVVPIWFAANEEDPFAHSPSFISTIYSKDGTDWKLGELIGEKMLDNASETTLAINDKNQIVASIRCHNNLCRALAISENGISDWQIHLEDNLPDPICQASMTDKNGTIYHSNCATKTDREDLTIKITRDDFKTYDSIYIDKFGGYSDIAIGEDEIYVLYEHNYGEELLFIKVMI